MSRSLTDFKALSFDCYGTLIDWETGIFDAFQPILQRLPADHAFHNKGTILRRFTVHQVAIEAEKPKTLYTEVLIYAYTQVAKEAGLEVTHDEALAFGQKAGSWPAFADSVAGLKILKKHYRLIILSNVDNININKTLTGPLSGVTFDAVITAEDVGNYKPDHRNFKALFNKAREFGLDEKKDLLHVARSLPMDHVPARELGLISAWIERGEDGVSSIGGGEAEYRGRVGFTWRFRSIGMMAEAVEEAFKEGAKER